jgi:hypothetical protein
MSGIEALLDFLLYFTSSEFWFSMSLALFLTWVGAIKFTGVRQGHLKMNMSLVSWEDKATVFLMFVLFAMMINMVVFVFSTALKTFLM